MKGLSYRDLQTLVAALGVLHANVSLDSLPERSTKSVIEIIQSEITSFDAFNSNDRYDFTAWTTCEDLYQPDLAEKLQRFVHQHPLIPVVIGGKVQSAIKMTDYISQSDFENLELYNEYFRLIRVRRQMGMALPVDENFTISCSVNRSGKDFSERDRLMLTMVTPHLLTAIRNAYFVKHLEHRGTRLTGLLDSTRDSIIVIAADENIVFANESTRLLLKKYFAGERFDENHLPESLRRWIAGQPNNFKNGADWHLPPAPLTVKIIDGELQINLTRNSRTNELTLMLTEKADFSIDALSSLGLTKRETEILLLIMRGKTNNEIALLCEIRSGTVKKHVENIYTKLGVENRAAAIRTGFEVLSGKV